ncbi:MAG TPA: hypothetical protein PL009_14570 [Flavipsychrobacter sp.]|nr:hypothetical protein [Flavipsychrobacter sp.]
MPASISLILECSSSEQRCHVIGIIHYSSLQRSDWWKKKGTSLILLSEVFVENSIYEQRVAANTFECVEM